MVILNKIYTRTGDDGTTALGTGERVAKSALRIHAYGTVDETNAAIGLARLHTKDTGELDDMLARIQNDLFDLGADLCTPETDKKTGREPLRMIPAQTQRLEAEIDALNANLPPLRSFVLPGGHPAAAFLHLARTIARRAERLMVEATENGEQISPPALEYINRLSDFLFVASRWINARHDGDIEWTPGKTRKQDGA